MRFQAGGRAVLCGLLWAAAALTAAEGPRPAMRVAAVDVSTVFKNYRKVYAVQKAVDATFEQEKKALEEQAKKLEELARDVTRDRQQLAGDSELLFDEVQRFQKQEFLHQKKVQDLNARIEKRYLEEMRDVLSEIRAAIRKESERGGFNLVLRAPDADDPVVGRDQPPATKAENNPADSEIRSILTPQATLELVARFRRNPVLYGSPVVDITPAVLESLNQEYDRRTGGKPATP